MNEISDRWISVYLRDNTCRHPERKYMVSVIETMYEDELDPNGLNMIVWNEFCEEGKLEETVGKVWESWVKPAL